MTITARRAVLLAAGEDRGWAAAGKKNAPVIPDAFLAVTDTLLLCIKRFDCSGQKLRHADSLAGPVCLNTVGNLRLDLRSNLLVILFIIAIFDNAACVRFSPFFHGTSLKKKKRGGGKFRPFAVQPNKSSFKSLRRVSIFRSVCSLLSSLLASSNPRMICFSQLLNCRSVMPMSVVISFPPYSFKLLAPLTISVYHTYISMSRRIFNSFR